MQKKNFPKKNKKGYLFFIKINTHFTCNSCKQYSNNYSNNSYNDAYINNPVTAPPAV